MQVISTVIVLINQGLKKSLVIIRLSLAVISLSAVSLFGQTEPGATDWARGQMTSTVQGGTGLLNTFTPRTLWRGELTTTVAYSNFKRDPGALDVNQVPLNLTVGLGRGLEGFVNVNFFQQVTARQPFLLSGPAFSLPQVFGVAPEQFFGPPQSSQGQAPTWPGALAPSGSILPPLGSPLALNGRLISTDRPAYFNDFPFAPALRSVDLSNPAGNRFQHSAHGTGNITAGVKVSLRNPDKHKIGLALIGLASLPSARNFAALTKGRGTGETDVALYVTTSQEFKQHRLRLAQHIGYVRKGDPARNGARLLDLRDEVRLSIGHSYALSRNVEAISELVATVFVGGGTPNYNPVNPVDYQTGLRVHLWGGRVSVGGAYRHNLTRANEHSNVPGFALGPNGAYTPTTFSLASRGASSFVGYLSFALRQRE